MCEHQRSRIFINMRKEEAYIFSKVDLSAKFQMESCFHLSLKTKYKAIIEMAITALLKTA